MYQKLPVYIKELVLYILIHLRYLPCQNHIKRLLHFRGFSTSTTKYQNYPRRRERRSIKMVLGDLGPNLELWGLNRRFAATGWRCRLRGLNRQDPDRLEPSVYRHIDMNMRLSPISDRLEICQNIYTAKFSSVRILHSENA